MTKGDMTKGRSLPGSVSNHGQKPFGGGFWNATVAAVPSLTRGYLRNALGVTLTLYILNQARVLPTPLSAIVSKTLFWPTLPITVGKRIGKWKTTIDDTVIMGGAPFGFVKIPEKLRDDGVSGVVNLCQEYQGPTKKYARLGIQQLWLPTVDHCVPAVEDLESAVSFIGKCQSEGKKVYVHCRAGHGRSAAVVLAWLWSKDPNADGKRLNEHLCSLRDVRRTLWKQPSIQDFHSRLLERMADEDVGSD